MCVSNILTESVDWKRLENLVHLDLSYRKPTVDDLRELNHHIDFTFRRCPIIRLDSLTKRIQHLALCDITVNADGLSFDGDCRFPALKYLSFTPTDQGIRGSNSIALQYFCKNSPELEHICFNGYFCNSGEWTIEEDDRTLNNSVSDEIIARSIGPPENLPSLRKLELQHWTLDDHYDEVWEMLGAMSRNEGKNVEELSLMLDLFDYSHLYDVINGNFKLKKLELSREDIKMNHIRCLVHLLNCEHEIQELFLDCTWHENRHGKGWPRDLWEPIKRDQFPKFIEHLKRIIKNEE